MAYRRTENVARKLAARRVAILTAAEAAAREGGMGAVQIAAVAARAGIAAGTVYRYFPSKTDLVFALVAALSEREVAALRKAADAAPGPLSALTATIGALARRALSERKLAAALLVDPVEADIDAERREYRRRLAAEVAARITTANAGGFLPNGDATLSATAIIGALVEGLLGPLASRIEEGAEQQSAVQTLTLHCLRALGIVDARARGLVAQFAWRV
ncbi:MAG: TetR/AcrR family transcriptional regulator [Pseudorhodoplanes sp.]